MLVLVNCNLIDGMGRDITKNASVVINGTRIKDAGSGIEYLDNAEVIDVQHCTIVPRYIDSHVHLGGFTVDKLGLAIGKVPFTGIVSFTWDYFSADRLIVV